MENHIRSGSPDSRQYALTFDDGPFHAPLEDWLSALENGGARGTFFFTGEWIDRNPRLARSLVERGHELASHSYHHRRMGELDKALFFKELMLADLAYQDALGKASPCFFRFPYIHFEEQQLEWLAEREYISMEGIDSGDWEGRTAEETAAICLPQLTGGSLFVFHCNETAVTTPDALRIIIQAAAGHQLEPITVSELLDALGLPVQYRRWELDITVPPLLPPFPDDWRTIAVPEEIAQLAKEAVSWPFARIRDERLMAELLMVPTGATSGETAAGETLLAGRFFSGKCWGYVRAAVQDDALVLSDYDAREAQADVYVYLLRWAVNMAAEFGCSRVTASHDLRRLHEMCGQLGLASDYRYTISAQSQR